MRIIVDLQGMQSISRCRGIGRFSFLLAKALVKNARNHEILLVLNGLFPETIQPIRDAFHDLLPKENIRVWHSPGPVLACNTKNEWRKESAELVREAFLASLDPDIILITSLFEGLSDDAISSIGKLNHKIPTAVVSHDLIPYIYRDHYLNDTITEKWYENKIKQLRRAQLILGVSESSRQEIIQYLNFPEDSVFNILEAVDSHFKPRLIDSTQESVIRQRFGLNRAFVMYVGGIDYRKNLEGLIHAYSKLPSFLRLEHQLAFVFSASSEEKAYLKKVAEKSGLSDNELVVTGFVSDEELITLYNLCKLFVFPSWHEGFGLPVLEAMSCGCAVIGSNTTSIPEVIGYEDALFDPKNELSITKKIEQALIDSSFREKLKKHGLEQAKKFSWDNTANRTIKALEDFYIKNYQPGKSVSILVERPRLAYLSPLPPQASGIADYSVELLPELSRYYEVDIISDQETISNPWINANCSIRNIEWFKKNHKFYNRVLYHFGNSSFHQHMFFLIDKIPGVIVLHDFFLSGILNWIDIQGFSVGRFPMDLYRSHGYKALFTNFKISKEEAIWKYPANLNVLEKAIGIISHSNNNKDLAKKTYGPINEKGWATIPLLRYPSYNFCRLKARNVLHFKQDDFIICSFGHIGKTKLNHRLLESFLSSSLAKNKKIFLIFVGENGLNDYGDALLNHIKQNDMEKRILITGFLDIKLYKEHLAAADLAVQLRTFSRGETSAAVLDCMNYGVATIVNAHGNMAELPEDAVWKLADKFENKDLVESLEFLHENQEHRKKISVNSREIVRKQHSPRKCADQYFEVIEQFYNNSGTNLNSLKNAINNLEKKPDNIEEIALLSKSIAQSIPPRFAQKQIFFDISELDQLDKKSDTYRLVCHFLRVYLLNPPENIRIEPVYVFNGELGYRYARSFTLDFLGISNDSLLNNDPIEYRNGDIFLSLNLQPRLIPMQRLFYQEMRHFGVSVLFLIHELQTNLIVETFLNTILEGEGVICIFKDIAEDLNNLLLEINALDRVRPFHISWVFPNNTDLKSNMKLSQILRQSAKHLLDIILSKNEKYDNYLTQKTVCLDHAGMV